METEREILEEQLDDYQEHLGGLRSFIKELNAKVAEHGTESEHYAEDLREAEHNAQHYEAEVARIKKLLKSPSEDPCAYEGVSAVLPQLVLFSSVSFVAGVILGSWLQSRRGREDAR